MWDEIFDKLARIYREHRSTLVFVNTRRLVEKVSFALRRAARPGKRRRAPWVALARAAPGCGAAPENGEIKILVATASLELGIDIGDVDLVCQIASTRAVAWRCSAWAARGTGAARFRREALCHHARRSAGAGGAGAQDARRRTGPAGDSAAAHRRADAADCRRLRAEPWEEGALFNVLSGARILIANSRVNSSTNCSLLRRASSRRRGRYGAYLLRDGVQGRIASAARRAHDRDLERRRHPRHALFGDPATGRHTDCHARRALSPSIRVAGRCHSAGQYELAHSADRIRRPRARGRRARRAANVPFWEGEAPQRTMVLSTAWASCEEMMRERRNVFRGLSADEWM
jgi:ATP-dependent Lhr-like helicase